MQGAPDQGPAGAWLLIVQFNPSFDACAASVHFGRSSGAVIYRILSKAEGSKSSV
jgi:hypothetical protein